MTRELEQRLVEALEKIADAFYALAHETTLDIRVEQLCDAMSGLPKPWEVITKKKDEQ